MLFVGGELADVGDDVFEEGLGGLGAMAAEGFDQAGFAEFVAGFVEGFGDAVGVEGESVAGVEGALADFAIPFFENAEDGGGGVEAVDRIVAAEDECGRMAAIDVAEAAGRDVVIGEEERGEGAVGRVLGEELIDGAQEALGLVERDGALAAEIGLQIGHEQSGGDAFAGNVADDEAEAIGAEVEEIVIVAADGARGKAVAGIVERADGRTELREEAALDFVGDFEFLGGAAFGFEFGGGGAALGFEGVGDFVEADEGEGVAVDDHGSGRRRCPRRWVSAPRIGESAWVWTGALLGIVLEALEAGRGMKADAAFGPFLKFGEDVFGDQDDVGGAADEFVFGRIGLGNDEGENRGTVGRGNGDEAFAGLEFGVVGEWKPSWSTKKRMLRSWLRTKMLTHWMLRWGGRRSEGDGRRWTWRRL